MPIKIIVTLFVAVVVAALVILFSQRMINRGELGIQSLGKTDKGVEIVKANGPADDTVSKLAEACAALNAGGVEPKDCFVVKGTAMYITEIAALDGQPAGSRNISVAISGGTPDVLFLSYDPAQGIVVSD